MASNSLNFMQCQCQEAEENSSEFKKFSVSIIDLRAQLLMINFMLDRNACLKLILDIFLLTS